MNGQYRCLRLLFVLKCAPEIFKCMVDGMLECIPAISVMDDIFIAAATVEEHNAILCKLVEKAANYNLQLKCHIHRTLFPCVGHWITADGQKPDSVKVDAMHLHETTNRQIWCTPFPRVCNLPVYVYTKPQWGRHSTTSAPQEWCGVCLEHRAAHLWFVHSFSSAEVFWACQVYGQKYVPSEPEIEEFIIEFE